MRRVPGLGRAPKIQTVSRRFSGAFGRSEDTIRGTTQSYVSSELCDINTIKASGKDLNGQWRDYCDCMFLEYRLLDTYIINGIPLVKPPNMPEDLWQAFADSQLDNAQRNGLTWEIQVEKRAIQSEPWQRCVAHYCASPNGCGQPDGRVDPFNMNPGMLADPWTEVGSATRGIAMRYADNGLRDLAAFTSINAADYDPLVLWATLWGNPAKYTLLIIKAQFIPFLGAYVLGIANPTGLIPMVADAIQRRPWLWPNGNVDLARDKYMLRPMVEGGKNFFGLVLKYLGKCGIGFNIPCGAGLIIQQICIDQIRDKDANGVSEFDKISSPDAQAVVLFLSRHGEELAQKAVNLLAGLKDGTILLWLEMVFKELLNDPLLAQQIKKDTRFALKLLAMGAGIAGTVWTGYQNKWPLSTIVDDIVFKLLGFRPTLIKAQVMGGQLVGAKNTLAAGASQTGVTLVEAAQYMKVAVGALDSLIRVVQDINNNIGGGLEELITNIRGAIDGTKQATAEADHAIVSVQQAVGEGPPVTPAEAQANYIQQIQARPPTVSVTAPPLTTSPTGAKAKQPTGGSSALIGLAAGGFVAGGPVGALIGAGIGLALSQKASSAFGEITLTRIEDRVSTVQTLAKPGREKGFVEQSLEMAKEAAAQAEDLFSDSISTARAQPKNAAFMAAGVAFAAWMILRKPTRAAPLAAYNFRSRRKKRRISR